VDRDKTLRSSIEQPIYLLVVFIMDKFNVIQRMNEYEQSDSQQRIKLFTSLNKEQSESIKLYIIIHNTFAEAYKINPNTVNIFNI